MSRTTSLLAVLSLVALPALGLARNTGNEGANSSGTKAEPAHHTMEMGKTHEMTATTTKHHGPMLEAGQAFTIVYKENGKEITRCFTVEKAEGKETGLRIVETEKPGGTPVKEQKTDAVSLWALEQVGFLPTSTPKNAKEQPAWLIQGPDNKVFRFNEYRLRRNASEKMGEEAKGPEGVNLVKVERWAKSPNKGYEPVKIEPIETHIKSHMMSHDHPVTNAEHAKTSSGTGTK